MQYENKLDSGNRCVTRPFNLTVSFRSSREFGLNRPSLKAYSATIVSHHKEISDFFLLSPALLNAGQDKVALSGYGKPWNSVTV